MGLNRLPATCTWSVVVPTFNRSAQLAECITSLAALEPPAGGFEIVIVNDGGREPDELVRSAAVTGKAAAVQFLSQRNSGPATARNRGAAAACGRWLAFIDDDCLADPGWLLALDRAMERAPHALVGGRVVDALDESVFSNTSHLLAQFTMAYFDGTGGRERFFTSNNMAAARSIFLEAGGFDGRFGRGAAEDREFCYRWHSQGRPSIVEEGAVVHHWHRLTLGGFLRQHLNYGWGAHLYRRVRRGAGRPIRIDPVFYRDSVRHAGRNGRGLRRAGLMLCTIVAHGAYVAGLAAASLRTRLSMPVGRNGAATRG